VGDNLVSCSLDNTALAMTRNDATMMLLLLLLMMMMTMMMI
jgi:hypothetical protein